MTYFGAAMLIGGLLTLFTMRHEVRPVVAMLGGRRPQRADRVRRRARPTGATGGRRPSDPPEASDDSEFERRQRVIHPRAEARRALQAAREAQARAEAARLERERAAADALAAARTAQTWAGYGYSYGGAKPSGAPRRRPSPRRTTATRHYALASMSAQPLPAVPAQAAAPAASHAVPAPAGAVPAASHAVPAPAGAVPAASHAVPVQPGAAPAVWAGGWPAAGDAAGEQPTQEWAMGERYAAEQPTQEWVMGERYAAEQPTQEWVMRERYAAEQQPENRIAQDRLAEERPTEVLPLLRLLAGEAARHAARDPAGGATPGTVYAGGVARHARRSTRGGRVYHTGGATHPGSP